MEFTMKLSPQNSQKKGQFTRGYLEWEMATLPGVQGALDKYAQAIYTRAEELLADEHRKDDAELRDGESPTEKHQTEIELYRGDVDRFVALTHPGGDAAAHAIEGGTRKREGMRVLERAASLPRQKGG